MSQSTRQQKRLLKVEEEFDIDVPDEERDNIKTVRDAVQLIQKLIS